MWEGGAGHLGALAVSCIHLPMAAQERFSVDYDAPIFG